MSRNNPALLCVIAAACANQACATNAPSSVPGPEGPGHSVAVEVTNPTTCTALVWRPDPAGGTAHLGTVPPAARRTFLVAAGTSVHAAVQPAAASRCNDLASRWMQVRQVTLAPDSASARPPAE
jgi:hypothetical protein